MRTTGLDQVRALAHPLRLRLLELFARQPRTAKQAAEVLGEPPTRLYHHVSALERAGLIRLRETRQNRGTTEKYYEAIAPLRPIGKEALKDKDARRDLASMGLVVFDQARNELVKTLVSDEVPENLVAVRAVYRLTPKAARELRKELTDVLKRLRGREKPPRGKTQRYALTIALVPTEEGM
ncbi:MAG TPA: helix-turn-helix domain-containing protein [Thermoanaerobaculia bacterium]